MPKNAASWGLLYVWCRRPVWLVGLLMTLFLGNGCSHYHLGSAGELSFETIYIAPVHNNAFVPQAQALLTQQLSSAFIRNGELALAKKEEADATLQVVIEDYQRTTSATMQTDTIQAQSYYIRMTVHCTLTNNITGKAYFANKQISATTNAFVDQDGFIQSEYEAIPTLTQRVAQKICDFTLNTW